MSELESCPSTWVLERFLLHELAATSEPAQHIVGCPRCQAALAERRAQGERFLASATARTLRQQLGQPAQVQVPSPAWRAWLPAALLSTVAVIASWPLLFPEPSSLPLGEGAELVAKGNASLSLWVERDEQVLPLSGPARAGERLQPAFATPEPGFAALLAVSAEGQVNALYPARLGPALPVAAQPTAPLGPSFRLDEESARYTLWLYFSTRPFNTETLAAELAAAKPVSFSGLSLSYVLDVTSE